MLVTPILHHAAAVLVMGPIAASLAQQIGCKIDPFLMAVAFGAGSDFLSPIGHQSNTLVMGLGGYRSEERRVGNDDPLDHRNRQPKAAGDVREADIDGGVERHDRHAEPEHDETEAMPRRYRLPLGDVLRCWRQGGVS